MPPNEAANGAANSTPETGGALRVRLGVQPRTFQKVWKRTFGYPFDSGRIVTDSERDAMESKYLKPVEEKPEPKPRAKKQSTAMTHSAEHTMSIEQGPVNVSAPQDVKQSFVELAALAVAFLIPTLASAFNTYNVSHQVAKDWRVAMFIMVMVMFTPALFIVARMNWVGAFVAFGVVIFEGFCNLSAIYLSLLGGMEYILDGKRGVCSDFLQSVVNLTNSDHRPTALLIGGSLAILIAATQLTAFWAIRNRIK